MSVGVAQVNVPSPSLLKNWEDDPSPDTFNSSAPTELSVMVAALTVPNTANAPNPKLLLEVVALATSDKLLALTNFVPNAVVMVAA